MKKAIHVLFALIICFTLVACGSEEPAPALPDSSDKVDEPKEKVIDLTGENWDEYFVIVPAAKEAKSDRGEIIGLTTWIDLAFKDDVAESVLEVDIHKIQTTMQDVSICWYTYHQDTLELSVGPELSESELSQLTISYQLDLSDVRISTNYWADKASIEHGFFLEYTNGYLDSHRAEGNVIYQLVPLFTDIVVDGIEGTITLTE